MNKIILTIAALLSLGVAGSAFAGAIASSAYSTGTDVTVGSAAPTITLKPSANVGFFWKITDLGVSYTLGSAHTKGTKTYASSSVSTKIYMKDDGTIGAGETPPDAPADALTDASWSGWTAMQ